MKALKVACILALLSVLAMSVPAAADEGPGVAEAPVGDFLHFIPVINNLVTGMEVMNLGATQTYIDIWYYAAAGPPAVHVQGPIKINGLSSRTIFPLPAAAANAQSAVVVSYFAKTGTPTSPDDDESYTYGHPIAVTVNRVGSGGVPAATYTGIGRPLLPADDDDGVHYAGQDTYWIYAPVVHKDNNTWNSTIWIQHAFLCDWYDVCEGVFPDADVDIYFYKPDGGLPVAQANLYIPAFASVAMPVPMTLEAGVYSVWIRAHSPICGVVDEYDAPAGDPGAANMFLSYRASPKNRWDGDTSSANFNFGPLIFSEYNGWDSGIAVLNTSETQDADVVATFRAKDGTVLATVNQMLEERSDWILYPLTDLPGGISLPVDQIGSVSIEAQNFWPPGAGAPVEPDNAIVAVVNQINPTASMGSAYNASRATFYPQTGDWDGLDTGTFLAAPLMMKYNGGTTLTSGWSTGIVVMNTDIDDDDAERISLSFWDAAGGPVPVNELRINLRGGTTHIIDMRYQLGNTIPSGWVGSCTVSSQFGADWTPIAAVVNEIYDAPAGAAQVGDFFMTYEAYPVEEMMVCYGDVEGRVTDANTKLAICGATVTVAGLTAETNEDGYYQILNVPGGDRVFEAAKTGYLTGRKTVKVVCEATTVVTFELICNTNKITGVVTDGATGVPIEGVAVTAEWEAYEGTTDTGMASDVTDEDGYYELTDLPKEVEFTLTFSKKGYDNQVVTVGPFTADTCGESEEVNVEMISHAFIQGRIWCDGLVSDNGVFDPGEEQADVLVRLYRDTNEDSTADEYYLSDTSDANGFYKFEVSVDPDFDGTVESGEDWFVVNVQDVNVVVKDVTPDEVRIVNIDICSD